MESKIDLLMNQINNNKISPNISVDNEIIKVNIEGEILKYPFVWLRDNCQCEQCFHTSAKSRIIEWTQFNVDIQVLNVEESNNCIKVTWEDGHISQYSIDWLKFRSSKTKDQKKYTDDFFQPPKITWNKENFEEIFTKHDYYEILETDKGLHDWLHNLAVYGVVLINNVPDRDNALDDIVAKIGFARKSHYGEKFIVQHVPNTSNVAYQNTNLQMHVDLPFYDYCAGVNLLHFYVQTVGEGGENLLIDGHFIANYMKLYYPKEYHLLTTLEVEWSDVGAEHGTEFHKLHRCPVICLNRHGDVYRICFSVPQRGSHFIGELEDVKPWYRAYGLFLELSHKFTARFKTKSGQILAFDNIRLVHGRTGYKDIQSNVRKLIGAYVDWDEVYSKLRCVKARLEGIEILQ